MIIRAAAVLLAIIAAFAAGFLLGGGRTPPAAAPISCVPSAPQIVAASSDALVVLFWGNSLLHDHDWRLAGATSVNCAMQGLTAAAAAPMVGALPEVKPDQIVLAFGSVEMARAAAKGAPVDDGVAAAVARNISALKERWPEARLTLSSAPTFSGHASIDPADAQALNDALARLAHADDGVVFFDIGDIFDATDAQLPGEATYDGVHLTRAAYRRWQAALGRFLGAP